MAPHSLAQARRLLVPINVFCFFCCNGHYKDWKWIVKPLRVAPGML
jgi:hypothetical protein